MTHTKFRVYVVVGLSFFSTLGVSPLIAQSADKECQCRAPGGVMRDLGTVQCVDIAGRAKLVLCTMSTNTPYWKDVQDIEGCPAA